MHRMVDNGRGLEATVTVEDPDTYYQPWTGLRRYRRVQHEYRAHGHRLRKINTLRVTWAQIPPSDQKNAPRRDGWGTVVRV